MWVDKNHGKTQLSISKHNHCMCDELHVATMSHYIIYINIYWSSSSITSRKTIVIIPIPLFVGGCTIKAVRETRPPVVKLAVRTQRLAAWCKAFSGTFLSHLSLRHVKVRRSVNVNHPWIAWALDWCSITWLKDKGLMDEKVKQAIYIYIVYLYDIHTCFDIYFSICA